MLLKLILSIILTSHADESVICKTLGFNLGYSEPRALIKTDEKGNWVEASNLNREVSGKWQIRPYYELNFSKKSDFQMLYVFEKKKFGPFKTNEEARKFACESVYKTKFKLLKKYKLARPIKPKNEFKIEINPGIQKEFIDQTFNQNIGCKPKDKSLELGNWQYDQGYAYTFGYKGEYFAYEVVKEMDYDPHSLLQLRGPYSKLDSAAQAACDLRHRYFVKKRTEFKEEKKNLSWNDLCAERPILLPESSPFINQFPRIGLVSKDRELVLTFEQLKNLNRWLDKYRELTPEERKSLISADLILTIEQIFATNDKKLISDLQNFEKKAPKKSNFDFSIPLKIKFKVSSWNMVLETKKETNTIGSISTRWEPIQVVDNDNLGELKLINFESALKKFCQNFKSQFNL